jgi:hypothetical protein
MTRKTLALTALVQRIEEAARATGIDRSHFRVDYKRNGKGELVVAILINANAPAFQPTVLDGEGDEKRGNTGLLQNAARRKS